MHRIKKLIWILCILWIVFFIICDEKWIKIEWDKDHIVLHETVTPESSAPKKIAYKTSDIIHIYPGFANPKNLRKSNGLDLEYLAKLEEEKVLEQERLKAQEKVYTWPSVISLNDDTISSVFQKNEIKDEEIKTDEISLNNTENKDNLTTINETWNIQKPTNNTTWEIKQEVKNEVKQEVKNEVKQEVKQEIKQTTWPETKVKNNSWSQEIAWFVDKSWEFSTSHTIKKYEHSRETLNLNKWIKKVITNDEIKENDSTLYKNSTLVKLYPWFSNPRNLSLSAGIDEEFLKKQEDLESSTIISLANNEPTISEKEDEPSIEDNSESFDNWNISENENEETQINNEEVENEENIPEKNAELSSWKEVEIKTTKVEKYNLIKHYSSLKKGEPIKQSFIIENAIEETPANWLSDPVIESLLENEEIDIDVLESENDEFLQKVFYETRDTSVMNLIVENYLNEYQFVKAKRFIENLPEMYRDELKPSLNLRVVFNSFALTSKSIKETLTSLIQNYVSKNEISEEDKNRYLWVIELMDRNYDKFFEISNWFTSEKNKAFASKLQWYKDQISKQMWMPEYYFDTLVALELFNQWLFQPAKVLALYSLQQNQNYILPYQILAYANFLTNSRDTSIEYLRKLMDIDPNNVEKYRFLMWVAYYRDGKYQQSVIMLSLIKDSKLRLDAERYLIRNYIILDQKNKLISIWNKILWYDNLVASDFYTYFYEAFYRPFSEWGDYQIFSLNSELANKMIRVCSMKLSEEENVVCNYWMIGKNIALWQFDGLEQLLLNLTSEYPQWYLYQALWEYYIQQWELDKAKSYLLKAVSMTKRTPEVVQIKKLLQNIM